MPRRPAAVAVGVFLALAAACPDAPAGDTPAAEVGYFLGESTTTTPDGKPVRTSLSLAKRVVDPAAGRIEEHVLSVGERDVKAFVVVWEVKGNKSTLAERSGAFTGEGELVGEAWKWKEWKSVTRLPGGAGTVTSEDKVTDRGLSAKKRYAGADGRVVLHFEDSLRPITAKTYDILHARLAPADKK
jgi:hypothetical protein